MKLIRQLSCHLRLMRPHHYVKNLFILLPLFFGHHLLDPERWLIALNAFAAFSLTASAVYILNDWNDAADDRRHPEKRHRPLAAGTVTPVAAGIQSGLLLIFGLLWAFSLGPSVGGLILLYLAINLAYTFGLKHIALIDVTMIALGFVIRLFVGAVATGIPLSHWIILMTFLLALFLAFAKRRDDVIRFEAGQGRLRRAVDGYNRPFLDTAMGIMGAVIIVTYLLYALSEEVIARTGPYLYLTSFFVILGVLRYLQITFVFKHSGNPTGVLFRDRFIQGTLTGWILGCLWVLYG